MTILAEFEFELGNNSGIVFESLLPELDGGHQRTKTEIRVKDNILFLKLEASDFVSMRAAVNGWLRLVKIVEEMCIITKQAVSKDAVNAQVINQL